MGKRTLTFGAAGVCLHGPYFFQGVKHIDSMFKAYPPSLGLAMGKTFVAQVGLFPLYLVLLFSFLGVAEGRKIQLEDQSEGSLVEKVKTGVQKAFMGGCVFWPCANMFNFLFIPGAYRAYYVAGCGSVWNCFLSWLNARDKVKEGVIKDMEGEETVETVR